MKYFLVLLVAGLIACAPVKGEKGDDGQVGAPGHDGSDGKDGQDGEDANPVTTVKLCPGESTYPSKFVEIALCIDGRLFAVYSKNGGFLTEIPPGTYSSKGIGSRCNLKVKVNCVVESL